MNGTGSLPVQRQWVATRHRLKVCHRARRRPGCPRLRSAAAPSWTPPVRGALWHLSMAIPVEGTGARVLRPRCMDDAQFLAPGAHDSRVVPVGRPWHSARTGSVACRPLRMPRAIPPRRCSTASCASMSRRFARTQRVRQHVVHEVRGAFGRRRLSRRQLSRSRVLDHG